MTKGLDQIFAKIKSEPRPTLVNRYLALVAELPEDEKAERALELAQHFVSSNPDEALRIARMIHDEQSNAAAPYDVMIAAMEAKGRYAKAEVLRVERDKRLNQPKSAVGAKKRQTDTEDDVFEEKIGEPSAMSAVSLDLDAAADHGGYNDAIDFLFEDSAVDKKPAEAVAPAPAPTPVQAAPPRQPSPSHAAFVKNLKGFASGPLDTVMPQHNQQQPASTAGSETPTLHLGSLTAGGIAPAQDPLSGKRWSEPLAAPYTPPPRELTFVELFDHYWRQGFFNEARDLLSQTSPRHGHEAWWQARQAQVVATLGEKKASIHASDRAAAAQGNAGPMAPDDFWHPIYEDMAKLTAGTKALLVPHAATEQLTTMLRQAPRGADLPDSFVKAIQEIDLRAVGDGQKDGSRVFALLRDLVSGLWGGAPDRACADVLLKLDAAHRDPGLWGFYLDGLIASGASHQALADMRQVLELKPKLDWARAAYRRLPAVWLHLGTYGFEWQDDEGVAALRERLAIRPRPKLASIVLSRSA